MLAELKFVQGAVAKKDFLPSLTHFVIENGTVRGYNGMIALSSPIPFDISCKPKADSLVKAIANCTDTVQLSITPTGRLSVRSGKFKVFIDCVEGETPHAMPEGERLDLDGAALLQALKVVSPFVGDDASRPWSNGVLLLDQSAFATNNITLVEYWTGVNVPRPMNIPWVAIKEMLRIDQPPVYAQIAQNSIAFHYDAGKWLRTQLFETEWPDLSKVLNRESKPKPIDNRLFEGLELLKGFTDKTGKIIFTGEGRVTTHDDENEGAGYDLEGFDHKGVYQIDMLKLLGGVAKTIDWDTYPAPCMFFGDRLRGAIIGRAS